MPRATALTARDWTVLLPGVLIIACLSQGVHDVAIEHLGIPYPTDTAVPAPVKALNDIVRLAATALFCRAAAPFLDRRSPAMAALATGALIAALDEALRVIVIEWVILDGWHGLNGFYVLTDRAPAILTSFYRGAVAASIARYLGDMRRPRTAIAILAAALFGTFVAFPAFRAAGPAMWGLVHRPEPAPLYLPPYDRHLLPFIYGMFVEPTVAALLMAALVWPSLGASGVRRIGRFVLLILFLRGRMISQLLYSFWIALPLPLAFAAEAQFFLETALLAALCGLLWARLRRRRAAAATMTVPR